MIDLDERIIDMTNEQLKMFVAVAEQGSFRGAAKAVNKTQSTISAAVKALENEFGVQLFTRDTYRAEPTLQGRAFYRRATMVLGHVDSLKILGHNMGAGVEPEFNIVISGVCPLPRLLSRITPVIDYFPQTAFKVTTEILSGVMERLNDGDAGLAFSSNFLIDTCHEAIAVDELTMINVSAPGYITSSTKGPISQDEVRQYSQIVIRDSARNVPKLNVNVVEGGRNWVVNDYTTKKELTIAGLGWGRIPKHLIEGELADGRLVEIAVEGIPLTGLDPVMMIRRRDRNVGPVAERLWQQFS
ncbi:MAG: LysR family transcriptional regulator [Alphaproteobacteria bacterium]|nr:LysR family transcriptional regulator [Alphaproteobacteria bacterium]